LVLAFSIAVAFMAGWLVLTIVLGNGGSTMVATADNEVPAMATKQPPRVENPRTTASPPIVSPRQLLSPQADPGWAGATGTARSSAPAADAAPGAPSGAALASLPDQSLALTPPATVPAAPSTGTPTVNDRLAVGDIYAQVTNKLAEDAADPPDIVPLPPHRPRTASVPFPRPRPQVAEQTQAQAEPRSFLDIFLNGNR
jgi:hypothetical protein